MTVFETMQEGEIKILSPLLLITDSWLWTLFLNKPLDSSWWVGGWHGSWGLSLLYSPLCWLRIKATFLFPPNSLWIFYSSSVGRESQDFSQRHTLSLPLVMVFPGWPSWGPSPCPPTLHAVYDPSSCCIVCFLVLIFGQLTWYIYNKRPHVFSMYLYCPPLPLKKKKKKDHH